MTASPVSAEPAPATRPQNVTEWYKFVSARLQRNAGSVFRVSRKHGIVGNYTVKIGFNLQPDGSTSDVYLLQGSGDERLDAATLRIPVNAAPFPSFTGDMEPTPRLIVAPLVFILTPVTPAPETP